MKTICVAFDFSPQAERALAFALRGFPFGPAHVDVCHVVDEELYQRIVGRRAAPSDEAVQAYVQEYIDRARQTPETLAVVETGISVKRGRPIPCILEHVQASGAAALMLGGQGHGGLGERFVGRTAQRVLRRCSTPLYIVKETAPSLDRRPILCAVDTAGGAERAITAAAAIATAQHRPLELVSVVEMIVAPYLEMVAPFESQTLATNEQTLRDLELRVLGRAVAERYHVLPGPPARTISRVATERHSGLVVLGSHGHGAGQHLLLGSVSETVAASAPVDVLVAR